MFKFSVYESTRENAKMKQKKIRATLNHSLRVIQMAIKNKNDKNSIK